jgi:starch synthase (maltosyl-transferring)
MPLQPFTDPIQYGPRIYNLFPRLLGSMQNWSTHLTRIRDLGFDWVYINPFHFPGYSGSLYAVKDYYQFHPLFAENIKQGQELNVLNAFIAEANSKGLKVMMDLVINHTAFDATLLAEHPEFYDQDATGQIKKPGAWEGDQWIEWGDLRQLDNREGTPHQQHLWHYWLQLIDYYAQLGITGFRCDAAYHVPSALWRHLITKTKSKYPETLFLAETLGCKSVEYIGLCQDGFDYVYNSSKWWDFKSPWFAHSFFKTLGSKPSISFAESHDTNRLAHDYNINGVKKRLIFSALFSTGWLLPIGAEFGFNKKLDVVHTYPGDYETPAPQDHQALIKHLNQLKQTYPIFNQDTPFIMLPLNNDNLVGLLKVSHSCEEKVLFIINLNDNDWQETEIKDLYEMIGVKTLKDLSFEHQWETISDDIQGRFAPGCMQVFYGTTYA